MKEIALKSFDKLSPIIYRHAGWASCQEYKPPRYDIVLIKDDKGNQQRGWWTGTAWDYGKKRVSDPKYWRRETEYLVDWR